MAADSRVLLSGWPKRLFSMSTIVAVPHRCAPPDYSTEHVEERPPALRGKGRRQCSLPARKSEPFTGSPDLWQVEKWCADARCVASNRPAAGEPRGVSAFAPPPRPCPGANLPPIPSGGVHASLYSFELGKIEGLRRRVNGSSGRWQVLDSRRAIHARVVARAPSLRADRCSPLFSSACSPFRVFAMSFPRGSHDVRVEGI